MDGGQSCTAKKERKNPQARAISSVDSRVSSSILNHDRLLYKILCVPGDMHGMCLVTQMSVVAWSPQIYEKNEVASFVVPDDDIAPRYP